MLKYIFAFIVLIHGLIHFMGFAKAFGYGDMKQLTIPISKPAGVLWMTVAFLFVVTVVLFLLKKEYWWIVAVIAAVLSQVVIIMSWKDAKFGTLANLIVLIVAALSFTSLQFEKTFRSDAAKQFRQNNSIPTPLISEADLAHLPEPVQKYLKYCGVINKPRVKNMRVVMQGEMRSKKQDWFPFITVQYNFFDEPTRLFFMKGKMFGINVPGYHHYINKTAVMDIRLFGLKKIVYQQGPEMNKAETVTLFNDMCLMAPATLIDKRIKWEPINDKSANAIFTNHNITVSAILYFNEQGQLIDFLSNDRTEINMMKNLPFTTPVHSYQNINGYKLFDEGDGVWEYTDGKFVYGKFKLKEIEYNLSDFKN